ncbi:MAG: hypothetical protein WEA04_03715 [Candidatus Andersenbacteria bacterium]
MQYLSMQKIDTILEHFVRQWSGPLSRFALFLVYFWFGALKLVNASPANPLVADLLGRTLPFFSFSYFIVLLGIYEMAIGLTFIVPRLERLAIALLLPHLIMITAPIILLPAVTWSSMLVPTLEGQYIIKNLLIIALALQVVAHRHYFSKNARS